MKHAQFKLVGIAEVKGASGLSKGQKQFNKLIKRIAAERKVLAAWQAMLPRYQQRYDAGYAPQIITFDAHRAELVRLFDAASSEKLFSKTDKAKLADVIVELTTELLATSDDPELKQIYSKHSGNDYDADIEADNELAGAMMREMFGVDLGDEFDIRSPEKMIEQLCAKMKPQAEHASHGTPPAGATKRKPSAKALAQQAQRKKDEEAASQSIRAVFRKLVSALHPDRETDAAEHRRKTALMQRVNVAYDANDLLALLELQLEVEQIDQTGLDTIPEDRLKHYNKVLAEQSEELRSEAQAMEFAFKMRFRLDPDEIVRPERALADLEQEIAGIGEAIEDIEADLRDFQDRKMLKAWLKSYRIVPRPSYDDFDFDPLGEGRFPQGW